jgi:hypothetical protein
MVGFYGSLVIVIIYVLVFLNNVKVMLDIDKKS